MTLIVEGNVLGELDYAVAIHYTTITIKPYQAEEFSAEIPTEFAIKIEEVDAVEKQPSEFNKLKVENKNSIAIRPPEFSILSLSTTGLLTLYVNEPLKIPVWPSKNGLTEQEVIEQYPIQHYLRLDVFSD